MENKISKLAEIDQSYKYLKISIGLSIIPFLCGIIFLIEPFFIFALIGLAPLWGVLLLLTLIFSVAGIVEGRNSLNEDTSSPNTLKGIYGNTIILVLGLLLIISVVITLNGGFV